MNAGTTPRTATRRERLAKTMTVSIVFVLLAVCAWGLYTRHMRLLYGMCALMLGLTLSGTALGGTIQHGIGALSGAVSKVSATVSQ